MTKGERKQRDILDVARPFLLSEGYPAFSLRDVAKRAGMSLGNLQYYFPSKDDLLVFIVQSEIDETLALIESVDWSEFPPEQTLKALIGAILYRLGGDGGQLYLLTAFLALHNDRFKKLQRDGFNVLIAASVEAARNLAPDLAERDLKMAALIAVSLVDGAIVQIHARPEEFNAESRGDFANALTNTLLRYLQAVR
ncbi:MAG: TetR/AcrR family transcriptional regulator [Pseudomonadota bacterium]